MNSATKTDNKELNKLRMVFEQTPGAIFILDKEFRFEYVNPSFEHLSGYAAQELLGKTVKDLFYHEEIQESRREVVEAMFQGKKWQGELLTHNKNGNTYWANTIAAPFKDENGEVEGYIMIQQDITEKKKVESALRESEEKYKTLVENSQDGILIVRNNTVLYANDTLCKLLGYSPEGLSGDEIIHREDIYKVAEIGNRRRNQDFSTINETFRLIAKNGDIKECDTTSTLIKFEGEWCSFFTIHDLTENKKIQLELKKSEQKYRELTEMLPLTVYELDVNNKPTYINKVGRELFGITNDKPDTEAMSFFVPDDRTRMSEVLRHENQNAQNLAPEIDPNPSDPAEYTVQKPDGTTIPVLIYGTAIVENGKPVGSRGVIVDISERKTMENALRESEKKYRELADFLPQTVFELDIEGNLLYVNKSGVEIMGVSDSDIGKSVLRFFVPEDRKRMAENLTKRARENRPNAMNEYTALRNDGKEFPVIIYALSVLKEGNPVGTRGIIVDISEQKAMENALRESEAKYKTLIENSQDGVFAIEDDKILFANQTFCNLVGYSSEELYNKSAMCLVHADDRLRGLKISELRKNGDYSTKNDIFRFIAQDGSIKEVDVFSSVIELNNKKVSLITVHDLTELKKIQTELIKSEQKYRELADFLPQTIFELDDKGNILYVNKTGMDIFGLSEMDYGLSCIELFVLEQREVLVQNMQTILAGKTNELMYEYMAQSRKGRVFPVLTYSLPVVRNGRVEGLRGMVLDISERKATEKILLESEKKYRELAEMLPQTVYELDLNANLKYLNKAGREKFGTDYETTDVSVFSIVIPEQMERMKQNFMNVSFKSIPSKGNFYKLKQINGQDFDAMISAAPMMEDGKNIGSRGIVVDLTDRIKIEQELQAAKTELEKLNSDLEKRVKDSSKRLTEARTQLINLQKENLQTQYDVLKQQVNPHFLFNSLNVLTSLIKLEPDLAEKFSEQLSKVYRYVLENKDNELVDLNTELNFLDAYIFLLNIRFIDKLKVNINIPENRRSDKIIPLAMQLLIENAIKHNTMSKSQPLLIDIYIDIDNHLVIINNLQERPSQLVSTGIGLKNIQNRYQLLNNTTPVFEKLTDRFIAKIPLVLA